MLGSPSSRARTVVALLIAGGCAASAVVARGAEPIVYTVKVPAPETHVAEVEAVVPTEGRLSIELMMPVWTPGYYRAEDYARCVKALSARTADGKSLAVEQPRKNRWHIATGGG